MSKRIIDSKVVDMTDSEWELYKNICMSYTKPNFKGEDLFRGLFHTDEDTGIILFLVPPTTFTSFEVFFFLSSLMLQQHLRQMHGQIDDVVAQVKDKLKEIK